MDTFHINWLDNPLIKHPERACDVCHFILFKIWPIITPDPIDPLYRKGWLMELTQECDYAVRAVLELARQPFGERLYSRIIAQRQGIPAPFLAKILAQLAQHGIVDAQRGPHGGVKLVHSPDRISLRDVVEAIEGPVALNRCARQPELCDRSSFCPVHEVWCLASQRLSQWLSEISFQSLAEQLQDQQPVTIGM
jgi:Rrf2 family protein